MKAFKTYTSTRNPCGNAENRSSSKTIHECTLHDPTPSRKMQGRDSDAHNTPLYRAPIIRTVLSVHSSILIQGLEGIIITEYYDPYINHGAARKLFDDVNDQFLLLVKQV